MKRTPHPVRGAYAYADAGSPCPTCKAAAHAWCTTPDGRVRRIPCVARLKPPIEAEIDHYAHAEVDPYQVQLPRGDHRPLHEQIRGYQADDE